MSENNQAAWSIENFLEVKNNQLYIDSVSAIELAKKFDTPLFVFPKAEFVRISTA